MPHDPALPHQHPSHVHDPAAATAAAAIAPAAPVAAPLHHDYHLQQPGVPHYAMGHSPIHHTPAHAVYPPPQHAAGPMQPMQPMYEQQPPPAHYSQPVHGHYGAPPAAAMHPMETGSHGAVAPPDQHLHHQ
ncbi:hypothetical protein BC831DRAFT_451691 [Entophlyctis helioformis]|nr:hypothetical protein BC831DRAFT_451691 [Entophlyctis helioformis]